MFASCLWHLRCDVELSVFTDALLTSDPRRVEGACAKATSLNLAQDHEGAVKCLQRAVAVSHVSQPTTCGSCHVNSGYRIVGRFRGWKCS